MNQGKHPKSRSIAAFALALVLCLTLAGPALAADDATASSIRLAKTEGTVSATNSAGRSVSLVKNLRLFNGYHVVTSAKSYAWLNLDSAKLLKEDASSNVEVRKSGKKLEVLVSSGNLFFNVTEPLDDNETLNIRTSTTLTGVRGTCGWVEVVDRWNTNVYILEGKVECAVTDPVSGEEELTTISAGETATFTVRSAGASATNGVKITKTSCDVDDVPGYVLVDLAGNRQLCNDIRNASGLDILGELSKGGDPAAEARRRQEAEEQEAAARLASIAAAEQAQASNVEAAANTADTAGGWSWRYDSNTKTLYIEGSGAMTNFAYRDGSAPWYANRQEIENIVISQGITHIGNYAFDHCTKLASVTIPESVTSIGTWAFYECTGISDVYYGGSETQWRAISVSASDKYNLNLATIHYAGTPETPDPAIPGDLTMVGTWGWKYDEGSRTLYIGGSGAMDDFGFRNEAPWHKWYKEIQTVLIGKGVTSIGRQAFDSCLALTSVTIPSSVKRIGEEAFQNCPKLTRATVPEGVTSIEYGIFMNCTGLTNVTLPSGVTSIGAYAFAYCQNLTSVNIPASVTSIGEGAFSGCYVLTGITIPSGVTSIGKSAFSSCLGLTSAVIPSGVTSIEDSVFLDCSGLTSVTIPASVTRIGRSAFGNCTGLTNVTLPSGVTSIGAYAFGSCFALTSVNIPSGVTTIESQTFVGCENLTSITLPSGVTSIGEEAFRDCWTLTRITIPSGVTSIGANAFYGCNMTILSIPASVTSIGAGAFNACNGLTDVHYGGTEAQWNALGIDSSSLTFLNRATIHYNSR